MKSLHKPLKAERDNMRIAGLVRQARKDGKSQQWIQENIYSKESA